MYYTTFKQLRNMGACQNRYQFLAKQLGGIKKYGKCTPISLLQILDINGLDDCLLSLRTVEATPEFERFSRLLACDFAEHVLPLFESKFPGDLRPRHAIETSRRYANGDATDDELADARAAVADARAAAKAEAMKAEAAKAWEQAWEAPRAARETAWRGAWTQTAAVADAAWVAIAAVAKADSFMDTFVAGEREQQWQEQHLREKLETE